MVADLKKKKTATWNINYTKLKWHKFWQLFQEHLSLVQQNNKNNFTNTQLILMVRQFHIKFSKMLCDMWHDYVHLLKAASRFFYVYDQL